MNSKIEPRYTHEGNSHLCACHRPRQWGLADFPNDWEAVAKQFKPCELVAVEGREQFLAAFFRGYTFEPEK